jgi:hypothetical protein
MPKRDREQENKEATEQARKEQQQREGAAALDKAKKEEAAKSDEQRAAEEEEARLQNEAKQKEEAERAAAAQKAADDELARIAAEAEARAEEERLAAAEGGVSHVSDDDLKARLFALSPDARLLKAGTTVHLNGEACTLPVDLPLVMPRGADEQHFASILARDPANLALNSDLLRLVYNPMNGTPLPLDQQRLTLEEMTDAELALFEAPPRSKK